MVILELYGEDTDICCCGQMLIFFTGQGDLVWNQRAHSPSVPPICRIKHIWRRMNLYLPICCILVDGKGTSPPVKSEYQIFESIYGHRRDTLQLIIMRSIQAELDNAP